MEDAVPIIPQSTPRQQTEGTVIPYQTPGCAGQVLRHTKLGICRTCYKRLYWTNGLPDDAKARRLWAWTYQGVQWTGATVLMYERTEMCNLCGKPFKNTKDKHLDHDHQTGEPRGVLCNRCNQKLGRFQDSPELLEKAAEYLRGIRWFSEDQAQRLSVR